MKKSFNQIAPIVSILVIGMLPISILEPVLPLYLIHVGFSSKVTGVLISILWLGMIIGESSWGWIADKIGIRIPMIWGTLISGIILLGIFISQRDIYCFYCNIMLGIISVCNLWPSPGVCRKACSCFKKKPHLWE